jgi:hypothetical protein
MKSFESKKIESLETIKGGMRKRRPKVRQVAPDPKYGQDMV